MKRSLSTGILSLALAAGCASPNSGHEAGESLQTGANEGIAGQDGAVANASANIHNAATGALERAERLKTMFEEIKGLDPRIARDPEFLLNFEAQDEQEERMIFEFFQEAHNLEDLAWESGTDECCGVIDVRAYEVYRTPLPFWEHRAELFQDRVDPETGQIGVNVQRILDNTDRIIAFLRNPNNKTRLENYDEYRNLLATEVPRTIQRLQSEPETGRTADPALRNHFYEVFDANMLNAISIHEITPTANSHGEIEPLQLAALHELLVRDGFNPFLKANEPINILNQQNPAITSAGGFIQMTDDKNVLVKIGMGQYTYADIIQSPELQIEYAVRLFESNIDIFSKYLYGTEKRAVLARNEHATTFPNQGALATRFDTYLRTLTPTEKQRFFIELISFFNKVGISRSVEDDLVARIQAGLDSGNFDLASFYDYLNAVSRGYTNQVTEIYDFIITNENGYYLIQPATPQLAQVE